MVATNFPDGVTNAATPGPLQTFIDMDPSAVHQYFNDFDVYTAGDFTVSATGSPTNSIVAGNGGILSMVNTAGNADLDALQLKAATFNLVAGKQLWMKARFNISNATLSALLIGLIQTTATPLTVVDGVYFRKDSASAVLTAKATKASTTSSSNVLTMVAATYVEVGLHYDGSDTIIVYSGSAIVARLPITNLPLAATGLNMTIALTNGASGGAQTLLVDYVMVAAQR